MGKESTTISFPGGGLQRLKTLALGLALVAALAGIFWYGGTRAPSKPEAFFSSALLRALREHDHAAFVRELDRLPSINTPDEDGVTALLAVAYCGDVDDLRRVLARGANVNCVDRGRGTPLTAVLYRRDADAARLLLRLGADARRVGWGGDSALLSAIRGGSVECVDVVLAAMTNRPTDLFPPGILENPLNCAAADDNEEMLRRLLAAGIDPNRAGANGQLPLITAMLAGSERSVSLLLRAGASVDLPDGRGRIARSLSATAAPQIAEASRSPAPASDGS